jgi:ribA/ribD-fused uncharacterized protein
MASAPDAAATASPAVQLPPAEVIAKIRADVAASVANAVWMDPEDPSTPPENTLWFYGHKNAYGGFSNFAMAPTVMGRHTWPTSEHYFQAMKFHDSYEHFSAILHAKGPMDAAKMGRDRSRPLRKDWEAVKNDLMFDIVLAKFTQHSDLQEQLLSTHGLALVEHTGNDAYWGDGGDGTGKNMLGITLMQVREVLRKAIVVASSIPPSQQQHSVDTLRRAVSEATARMPWVLPDGGQPANTLWFYSDKKGHGCFSNFFAVPITMGGLVWPTSEHYFQAMKFHTDQAHFDEVRSAKGPMDAAKMGRDRSRPLRKDWEAVKNDLMFDVVLAKFTQHSDLQEQLLSTGSQVLIEHTKNDAYWGDGGDGTGKNMLGITLMQVREVLRSRASA